MFSCLPGYLERLWFVNGIVNVCIGLKERRGEKMMRQGEVGEKEWVLRKPTIFMVLLSYRFCHTHSIKRNNINQFHIHSLITKPFNQTHRSYMGFLSPVYSSPYTAFLSIIMIVLFSFCFVFFACLLYIGSDYDLIVFKIVFL